MRFDSNLRHDFRAFIQLMYAFQFNCVSYKAMPTKIIICFYCLFALLCSDVGLAQQTTRRVSPSTITNPNAAARDFETIFSQATAAREAKRLGEAADLYRGALNLRPEWVEGRWYLATVLYAKDEYAEAAREFQRLAAIKPEAGATWGMLGLCEYQIGRYDEALMHIQRSSALGFAGNPELTRTLRYHEGILLNLKGEFERAQQALSALSDDGANSENVINALGLAVLRSPVRAKDVNSTKDREIIRRAGWAEHLAARRDTGGARREYERLSEDYPKTRDIHYAYGRFLLAQREDEKAMAAFSREIENSPNHAIARFQIALIKLNHKQDVIGAIELARQGVKLNPNAPFGHYILGQLLFNAGKNEEAIYELEVAQRSTPDEARIYYALARAYARANRQADAERARANFKRLKQPDEAFIEPETREDAQSKHSKIENNQF